MNIANYNVKYEINLLIIQLLIFLNCLTCIIFTMKLCSEEGKLIFDYFYNNAGCIMLFTFSPMFEYVSKHV